MEDPSYIYTTSWKKTSGSCDNLDGNEQAFESFFDTYFRSLYRFAYSRLIVIGYYVPFAQTRGWRNVEIQCKVPPR